MRHALAITLLLLSAESLAEQAPVSSSGVLYLDSAKEFVQQCSELHELMPRVETEEAKTKSDKLTRAAMRSAYAGCLAVIKTAAYTVAEADSYRLKDGPRICRRKDASPKDVLLKAKDLYNSNPAEFDKMGLSGPGIVLVAMAALDKCD